MKHKSNAVIFVANGLNVRCLFAEIARERGFVVNRPLNYGNEKRKKLSP